MKLIQSKLLAWVAMLLVVVLVVISVLMGTPWYGLIAEFFCFMSVFSHIASLYLRRMSPAASSKLEVCAMVCLILAVIGFVAEYVIFEFVVGE